MKIGFFFGFVHGTEWGKGNTAWHFWGSYIGASSSRSSHYMSGSCLDKAIWPCCFSQKFAVGQSQRMLISGHVKKKHASKYVSLTNWLVCKPSAAWSEGAARISRPCCAKVKVWNAFWPKSSCRGGAACILGGKTCMTRRNYMDYVKEIHNSPHEKPQKWKKQFWVCVRIAYKTYYLRRNFALDEMFPMLIGQSWSILSICCKFEARIPVRSLFMRQKPQKWVLPCFLWIFPNIATLVTPPFLVRFPSLFVQNVSLFLM